MCVQTSCSQAGLRLAVDGARKLSGKCPNSGKGFNARGLTVCSLRRVLQPRNGSVGRTCVRNLKCSLFFFFFCTYKMAIKRLKPPYFCQSTHANKQYFVLFVLERRHRKTHENGNKFKQACSTHNDAVVIPKHSSSLLQIRARNWINR